MYVAARSARRADLERKAGLAGARLSARSRSRRSVGLNRHVLRQPVEYVGTMPADRFATVSSPLGELSECRQAQQKPARPPSQARDLASTEDFMHIRKRLVDPTWQSDSARLVRGRSRHRSAASR